jgi:glycosyltransferase involved in cell wall biosynthesis
MDGLRPSITDLSKLRVAIVHYWFIGRAGGERVVEAIAEVFPQADLFALIADESQLAPILQARQLRTSFLQHLPGARRFHRHFLMLHPLALEQFDLSSYDLVISSESGPAKGVITSPKTCHVCYCHSPMRYIWDLYPEYRKGMNPVVRAVFSLTAHYIRLWDYASAARVDYFVANSRFVSSRIRKLYGRESTVIYPPVDAAMGTPQDSTGDYYLAVGRMVDYKRFDLAVLACTQLGRHLKVIGSGPELKRLRRMAGPTVEFLSAPSDHDLRNHMAHCRALLFPGEEDFGMVPVEAQSCGRPVIAYASGGALETVRGLFPGETLSQESTGVFFSEQTPAYLADAILRFEALESDFDHEAIREHSLQFDRPRFKMQFSEFIAGVMHDFQDRRLPSRTEEQAKPVAEALE